MATFDTKMPKAADSIQKVPVASPSDVPLVKEKLAPPELPKAENHNPPKRSRLPYIDGLRAVAMLFVFVYHCHLFALTPEGGAPWLRALLAPFSMSFGTSLFITISGFCLYLPVVQKSGQHLKIGQFLLRRVYRIYPPYFIALCLYTALAVIVTLRGGIWIEGPDSLLGIYDSFITHLVMMQAFIPEYCFTLNHPLWTLTLECSNYLTFPLLVVFFRRFGPLNCYFATLLLSLTSHFASGQLFDVGYINESALLILKNSFVMRWSEFVAGMLAAHVIVGRQQAGLPASNDCMTWGKSRLTWQWLLVGAALCFGFGFLLHQQKLMANHIFGISALLMILGISLPGTAQKPNPGHSLLSSKPLAFIGLTSYSFYLLHEPILRLLLTLPGISGLSQTAMFCIAVTLFFGFILGIAAVFDTFCVKPFTSSKRRSPSSAADSASPGSPSGTTTGATESANLREWHSGQSTNAARYSQTSF